MTTLPTNLPVLHKLVEKRLKLINFVIDYVTDILRRRGKTLEYHQHSCHTTSTEELKDFADFTFWSHGSFTMFGGDQVKLHYQGKLVFDVKWWDRKEPHIGTIDQNPIWSAKLKEVKRLESRIAARIERKAKKEQEEAKKRRDNANKLEKLQETATRLQL